MKVKLCLSKISALIVSVAMLLSLMYVPVSAGVIHTGAFSNVDASMTDYDVDEFLAEFVPAPYAIVQTFENSGNYTPEGMDGEYGKTASNMTSNVTIPIANGTATYNYTLEHNATNPRLGAFRYSQTTEGTYSSGTRAIELFSTGKAIRFTPKKNGNTNMARGHNEYNHIVFACTIYAISANTTITATIVYDDDTTFNQVYNLEQGNTHFFGFKAPEDKNYIKDVTLANSASIAIDDIAVIMDITEASVVSSVGVSGPDTVYGPHWMSTKPVTYEYSTSVLDQFWLEMPEEPVTVSLDSSSDAVTFADGVLTIMPEENLPETVTINVTSVDNPLLTASKTVTIKNEPYYRSDRISSIKRNRKTVASLAANHTDKALTRDEFVAMLDNARQDETKDMAIVNFDEGVFDASSSITVPLANRKDKTFTLRSGARNMNTMKLVDGLEAGVKLMVNTSGDGYGYVQSEQQGGNEYIFDTTALGDLRVTAVGVVCLAYNYLVEADGFKLTATYSDGTKGEFTHDQGSGGKKFETWVDNNIFQGIQAPPGHYITNLVLLTTGSNSSTYSRIDDFGFLLEEPDILDLERDYEELAFSKLSNEEMDNITKDLTLPQTIGTSTVNWTSEPAGVIAQDGTLTPPDLPTENGDTPRVNLKATLEHGVLAKERIFELYVPSKIERDLAEIEIPQKTKKDLTLPTEGSIFGSTITWSSDDHSVMGDDGDVKRPEGEDVYVVLTATITNDSGSITKEYGITVEGIYEESSKGGGGGRGSKGGGGGSISAMPSVSVPKVPVEVKEPTAPQEPTSEIFGDLLLNHWAHDSIINLYKKGIVNGTGDGDFTPEGKVTREQFLSMLVRAFELTAEDADAEFSDVASDSWYAGSVKIASKLGISGGYDDGTFGVGKEITREEMAVMAYRAAIASGITFEKAEKTEWKDAADISEFAVSAISTLNKKGIINGVSESEFSPKTTTTRAQAAVIIERLLGVNVIEE